MNMKLLAGNLFLVKKIDCLSVLFVTKTIYLIDFVSFLSSVFKISILDFNECSNSRRDWFSWKENVKYPRAKEFSISKLNPNSFKEI